MSIKSITRHSHFLSPLTLCRHQNQYISKLSLPSLYTQLYFNMSAIPGKELLSKQTWAVIGDVSNCTSVTVTCWRCKCNVAIQLQSHAHTYVLKMTVSLFVFYCQCLCMH